MTLFKSETGFAILRTALLGGFWAVFTPHQARAFDDYTGPLGGTTSIYGQFSPSFLSVRDGTGVYRTLADNSHSVSRIGLVTKRDFDVGQFSLRFETEFGFRQSNDVSQISKGEALEWDKSDVRFLDAAFRISRRGTLSVGHGSMSTDQVAMADLSGTGLANNVSVPDMAGGMFFRTDDGQLSAISVDNAFNTFDGVRRARLRYDFRNVHGLVLSVSAGAEVLQDNNDEENFDIAATYQGDIGAFDIQAAAGASMTWQGARRTRKDLVGSVSALHRDTGASLTFAAGQGSAGGLFSYFKVGYKRNWSGLGVTSVSIDYHLGHDIAFPGSTSEAWGIGLVQNLIRYNVDVFVGYRGYALEGGSRVYQDIHALQMGARWRF